MAQIKIYGQKAALKKIQTPLSDLIHESIVDILSFPKEKRFHRFIGLDKDDFIYPPDRSENYIIIEIMMMEGREVETKKRLIKRLFTTINHQLSISVNDIEITIIESPACNWGFRGKTGDEIQLNYQINV